MYLSTWTSKYHLAFAEIETMPLELLLDLEVVDSKIEATFVKKRSSNKKAVSTKKPFIEYYI